jgi:hypothetical protein
VAWSDGRSTTYDIYASRVSTGGVVRDGAGAPFSTAAGSQTSPAIAYDGTYALIVWEDARSGAGYDVYGARWDPAAGLVDPGGLAIARGVQDEISPDVAANGTFLVVWSDSRWRRYDLYATRVQANGTVTDPEGFALTMGTGSGGTAPSVIKGHGGNWTTVYEYDRAAVWNTISPK